MPTASTPRTSSVNAVVTAADGGYVTNTQNKPFGFYLSAQVTAEAVAYWAINRSTALYDTTVDQRPDRFRAPRITTPPCRPFTRRLTRAAMESAMWCLTNKGSNAAPVQIVQDGVALTNSFLETFVTGSDPSATNSAPEHQPHFDPGADRTNPVTIPEYSVVRLEWTVFDVPPPSLTLTVSNPARTSAGWV
jgi:hypothetical protein